MHEAWMHVVSRPICPKVSHGRQKRNTGRAGARGSLKVQRRRENSASDRCGGACFGSWTSYSPSRQGWQKKQREYRNQGHRRSQSECQMPDADIASGRQPEGHAALWKKPGSRPSNHGHAHGRNPTSDAPGRLGGIQHSKSTAPSNNLKPETGDVCFEYRQSSGHRTSRNRNRSLTHAPRQLCCGIVSTQGAIINEGPMRHVGQLALDECMPRAENSANRVKRRRKSAMQRAETRAAPHDAEAVAHETLPKALARSVSALQKPRSESQSPTALATPVPARPKLTRRKVR